VAVALLGIDGTERRPTEMPTTAFARAEPAGANAPPGASAPPTPLRRYELSTTGGSEVLMRILGLVRRRCGEVVTLDFQRGDRHRPSVLEIAVAIDALQGSTLALRLEGLIDVLAVREY
jgi:acetolactate synthase regulatory subunit